jgi:precorrin-4 methylase
VTEQTGAGAGQQGLLGARPGAPDLLTLRAARALGEADVVIWGTSLLADGLVSELARPDAEHVPWPPAKMEDIHAVYDRAAAEGLVVARLLWGDPALFGSVRDEVRQAQARGLDYEIVPGISAFNMAAAALEIDLTVAPVSSLPLVLTQARGEPVKIRELARHGGTLAIFMIGERSEELQRELIAGGYDAGAPCAIVHRVTLDGEVVVRCRIDELAATVAERDLDKHSLVIVGPALEEDGPEFKPPG